MSTIAESLVAYVGADISEYSRKVGGAVPRIARAASKALRAVGRVGALGMRALGAASHVAKRGLQVFGVGAIAAAYEAASFEKAMAEVASISNASRRQIDAAAESVRNLAVAYGQTPTQMVGALYQTISAGVTDLAEATKLLDVASKTGIAGVTDTKTAVDILTTIVNSYGMTIEDATRVSDVLFTTVREGKVIFPELAATFGRMTSIAAGAGVSLEELAAATATLTKGGLQADTAVTSLRQIIISIIKPGETAQETARRLGVEFSAQALKARGLAGVLAEVAAASKGDTEAIAALFPNVRALTGAMNLAGKQSAEFARQIGIMKNAAGATEKAFAKMSNTTSFKVSQAWASIRASFGRMGTVLLPTVNKAAAGIAKVFEDMAGWVDEHSEDIKKGLDDAWLWIVDQLTWLKDEAKKLLNEMKGDHVTVWDAIKEKMRNVWEWLKEKWEGAKIVLKPAWDGLHAAMLGDWDAALAGLSKALEEAVTILCQVLIDAIPIIVPVALKLGYKIGAAIAKGIYDALKGGVHDVMRDLIPGLGPVAAPSQYNPWEREGLGEFDATRRAAREARARESAYQTESAQRQEAYRGAIRQSNLIVNQVYQYPTGQAMHERLMRDVARVERRGRGGAAWSQIETIGGNTGIQTFGPAPK